MNLDQKVVEMKLNTLKMCYQAGKGHISSCFSCAEILVALYQGGILRVDPKNPDWEDRDLFIMSKGQSSPILYNILADMGFFPKSDLDSFVQPDGKFGVHLQKSVPGVELTCGSLGQGYGVAAGAALANKMDEKIGLVFALLGDGELYEGSIWESAMFAAHNRLNNLVTIVDRNFLCTTEFTENLVKLEPLDQKWASFGFRVETINGHDLDQIFDVCRHLRSRKQDQPTVIIAETVKGYGVEAISDNPAFHGITPPGQLGKDAIAQLEKEFA